MSSLLSPRHVISVVVLNLLVAGASAQTPEFRAMWVTRFEWTDPDPATCMGRITAITDALADHHFNAVFLEVRAQADTLYPSPEEPWSALLGGSDPGRDPLAYAIAAAHARGLQVHAWINVTACRQDPGMAQPPSAAGLFYEHGNARDPQHRDWLIHDSFVTPAQWAENTAWMAPSVPEFQAYVRRQVRFVAANYDVDGIHLDGLRTPGPGYSYDPISVARQASVQGNPDALSFGPWMTDQVTRLVRDIYVEVFRVKPRIRVSATALPHSYTASLSAHQEARSWLQTGGVDTVVPTLFFAGSLSSSYYSSWEELLRRYVAVSNGRHIVAGQSASLGTAGLINQVGLTRANAAHGNSIWSCTSFDGWSEYLAGVYQQPASTPAMTWKDAPVTGVVYGYITDADGQPVVDALVTRPRVLLKSLSSGDGFYSMLSTSPGNLVITATHAGYAPSTVSPTVSVTAGQASRCDIVLGAPIAPQIGPVTPNPGAPRPRRPYICPLTLTQGVATSWTLLDGPAGAWLAPHAGLVRWVPRPTQAGSTVHFAVQASGPGGSDEESWDVTVPTVPVCTDWLLTGFEGYAPLSQVLFDPPSTSGSTAGNLTGVPNVAQVTTQVPAAEGAGCYRLSWTFRDGLPSRWVRIVSGGEQLTHPVVSLERPIRLRLRLSGGKLRVCIGLREVNTDSPFGSPVYSNDPIEFVGASSKMDEAPQGVLVEPLPEVWQTLTFDPRKDPIIELTGDGVLDTPTGKGVLDSINFSLVDAAGPFDVYIDQIEMLCASPADFDLDNDSDQVDFAFFQRCFGASSLRPSDPTGCRAADLDVDGDVDETDFAGMEPCLNGSGQPPRCS